MPFCFCMSKGSCKFAQLLSASLYVSKRGAYWDRLCDCVVTSLVVTRVHCGQTVHPRPIVTMELIGNPTPGIQWYNFRPPGVTPNRGMGPPWGAFCQITLTSCWYHIRGQYIMYVYILVFCIVHCVPKTCDWTRIVRLQQFLHTYYQEHRPRQMFLLSHHTYFVHLRYFGKWSRPKY